MTKFQLVLSLLFGFFIFLGVLLFASGQLGKQAETATISVWGTLPADIFNNVSLKAGFTTDGPIKLVYTEKKADDFDADFIEALASGVGPDLFFLPQASVLKHQDKVSLIPFKSVPLRDFQDIFIEQGEIFVKEDGIVGLPFMLDPMVMYWNRSMFSNAGYSLPPKYWNEFYDIAPVLTQKDAALNVSKSAVALGEYANVSHAQDILSLLIMQAGGDVTARNNGKVESVLGRGQANTRIPSQAALSFYTEFVNPVKPHYSWNRALLLSKNQFAFGDLATYFGYASEIFDIQKKNPNLNFDVAKMPQSADTEYASTFGKMTALAVTKASRNKNAALQAAITLVGAPAQTQLALATRLPPVRRDLLASKPTDNYLRVFYESAIQSRGWLSPDAKDTAAIFKEMIESVTAGRKSVTEAVSRADAELGVSLVNIQK